MTEGAIQQRAKQLIAQNPPSLTDQLTFLKAQFDLGLGWVAFPEGRGGSGVSRALQYVVDETVREAGGPLAFQVNPIGYGMAAPTLLTWAKSTDLDRLLRPLFTGEEIWCQMFSEPGAGSDVAALSTRAVRDGDGWVVNGQKIWTSLAHVARWGLLVTRTDPSVPKHAGLTYFFVDMHSPGIEVRPLRQASGDAQFNEVYLTDVRIPDAQRLGEVGDGWKVALTTLMNERVSIGGRTGERGSGPIAEAVRLWRAAGSPAEYQDRLMKLWVRSETLRLSNQRTAERAAAGAPAGPEGSISKLIAGELNQDIYEFGVELLGGDGMLHPETYDIRAQGLGQIHSVQYNYLRSLANTIEGGSSEVMRNILGEHVLGLAVEPRVDKGIPFVDVRR